MAFEINDGHMWLLKNEKHEKGDNLPCLRGDTNIGGVIYEVAVWPPWEGKKAYHGIVKVKQARTAQPEAAAQDDENEVPF